MPLQLKDDTPQSFPSPQFLTLANFKRGVITLLDKSNIPKNALERADNLLLAEDGMPETRPGVDWYGTAPTYYSTGTASQSGTTITGVGTTFTSSMVGMTVVFSTGETATITTFNSTTSLTTTESQTVSSTTYVINAEIDGYDYFDIDGVIHLVVVAGGKCHRSLDDAVTWSEVTGATFTIGETAEMNQNGGYLYITTGADQIARYDGTTTLQSYTSLSTPGTPTATKTGLAATTYSYHYKVSAVNQVGFTAASVKGTVTVSTTRDNWDATSNFVTVTHASVASALRYDYYISEDDLDYFYLGSSTTTSFKDDGSAIVISSTVAPTANTTTGPLVEELSNIGSRMYGVRDRDNRYRIWFSGTGVYAGAFSSSYDGGYLDWQEGGKLIPVKVEDYRDGKGTPYATIWCKSADGQGGILQMSLDTLTIGDISITVPSAYLLPGSRGTPSPGSVVNVLNDYMFYNSQAFYNLGSRAQYLNLLSTDEASANIRPTIKQIPTGNEDKITSVYFDAKVYFSVGFSQDENSHTVVYDTERKAWLPTAFTLGFKKFLRYTDTDGIQSLLAIKPGDTKLSIISEEIAGDYGVPFRTYLSTGLYPTSKNRFDFQFIEEGELEFTNPQGYLYVDLLGIDRKIGYGVVKSKTINADFTTTGVAWDNFHWDTSVWDDTSVVAQIFSESSVKRYFSVQRELNAVQWNITTESLASRYRSRTFQTWGTETLAGKPRGWRIGSTSSLTGNEIVDDNNEPLYI